MTDLEYFEEKLKEIKFHYEKYKYPEVKTSSINEYGDRLDTTHFSHIDLCGMNITFEFDSNGALKNINSN